jgi:hypothetical protein
LRFSYCYLESGGLASICGSFTQILGITNFTVKISQIFLSFILQLKFV